MTPFNCPPIRCGHTDLPSGTVSDICWQLPRSRRLASRIPDIFYTDKAGYRNRECLSLGCDDVPLLAGRTPVEVYSDFIEAFSDSFDSMFGAPCTDSQPSVQDCGSAG